MRQEAQTEEETRKLGRNLAAQLQAGSIVLLEGALGAGKTTLVRGVLEGLGFSGQVRSPTFNIIQTFPTIPPVMHADLYRLTSTRGTGIEDYLDSHVCLIEWPERADGMFDHVTCWRVRIEFTGDGRTLFFDPPEGSNGAGLG